MKTAILVHGRPNKDEYYDPKLPTPSNDHWFPWLSKQLLQEKIHPIALEIPQPFRPRYSTWKEEFERFDINVDTILIGHSCGGGFLVRWLSENKDKAVGKVILVAPWTNPDDNLESDTADFFHFDIDPDMVERTEGITIFTSDNDFENIEKTVSILKENINDIKIVELKGYGHFVYEHMKKREFPELLKEVLA